MKKRLDQGISLRRMAEMLDTPLPFLCDLEKNRLQKPEKLLLDRIVAFLVLTEAERILLYGLAAKNHAEISPINPVFNIESVVHQAIVCKTKDNNISEEAWL
jgi:hypothetical protein